jgi:RNA polymerase sigma-70 factor, ECF subfamily
MSPGASPDRRAVVRLPVSTHADLLLQTASQILPAQLMDSSTCGARVRHLQPLPAAQVIVARASLSDLPSIKGQMRPVWTRNFGLWMETGLLNQEAYLINRLRAGEAEVLMPLLAPHLPALKAVIRTIVRDPADAEDAMQECLLKIICHISQFHPGQSFRAWLRQIALHEALKLMRWNKRHPQVADSSEEVEDDISFVGFADPGGSPADALELKELERAFVAAVEALDDIYRTVFTLRYHDELSIPEVASRLGIKIETANSRLHRARLSLYWYVHSSYSAECERAKRLTGSCSHQRRARRSCSAFHLA